MRPIWIIGYSGIQANIFTPGNQLHSEPCDQSYDCFQYYAVSTMGPHWVQAGWSFTLNPLFGMDKPKTYYEYCTIDCENHPGDLAYYRLQFQEDQNWGTTVNYQVYYDGTQGNNYWCTVINSLVRNCYNTQPSPASIIAQAEIHNYPSTEMFTLFDNIKIRNTNGFWIDPNLDNNLAADTPYQAIKIDYKSFLTVGRGTGIYLPIIKNTY